MSGHVVRVGMGEGVVTREPAVNLTAAGLGSCVAVIFYDSRPTAGAMAHIMLPHSSGQGGNPFKYADSAIPLLLRQFEQAGGNPRVAAVKIAGGAQMFRVAEGSPLNIGRRNVEAVHAVLRQLGLRVQSEETGGSVGRTVCLEIRTGRTTVRFAGGQEREL